MEIRQLQSLLKLSILDMERNQSIDIVKIIAMYGVLALHVFIKRIDMLSSNIVDNNIPIISIPLFIMASGYLL